MIHLDTSFLIRSLVVGSEEEKKLLSWYEQNQSIAMSVIALGEFLCGPVSDIQLGFLNQAIPLRANFEEPDAILAARLFNETGRRRHTFQDCMIAATAINAGAQLATSNKTDFERMAPLGLTLA